MSTRAYENMVGVAMANPNGENAGNSCAFSPICWDGDGKCIDNVILMADELSEGVFYAEFDMDKIRSYREREMLGNTDRKVDAYHTLLEKHIEYPFMRENQANSAFEQTNKFGLQMFYTADMENVYYAKDIDCFVVAEMEEDTLLLQSIVCKKRVMLSDVLNRIGGDYRKCRLGFVPTPPDMQLCIAEHYDGSDDYRLFYLGENLKSIEQEWLYFPELSHA